jgi:hypothetical protein
MVASLLTPSPPWANELEAVDSADAHVTLFLFERKVQNAHRRTCGMSDIHSRLMHQSLGRPLTPEERTLADALEAVFRTGEQDFENVARALTRDGVKRPSGTAGPWTAAVLEQELATINASLDAAYAENGIGA